MSAVPRPYRAPIRREGAKIDAWARAKYGISGPTLLAKLGKGEGNFARGRSNPSSAGARGAFQFMPGTRDAILQETGADAYGSPAEATRAARIYLRRGGLLENYNPGGGQQYVNYILGQRVGKVGGRGGSGDVSASPGRLTPGAAPGQGRVLGGLTAPENPGTGLAALLSAQVENPPVPQTGPTLPAFSARRFLAMPEGFQAPSAPPPGPQGPTLSELLDLGRGAGGGDLPMPEAGQGEVGGTPVKAPRPRAGGDARGTGGSISLAAGADRPGVGTSSAVKRFARRVSAIYGRPLTIGTGSQHSRLTVDGNVSDHWGGHAGDIPATGKALIRLGQAALIAAGMPKSKARKQTGDLYNVNGHQIIFNTQKGGDHTDHLHISAY